MKKVFSTAFMVVSAFAFVSWINGTPTTEARSTYYSANGCQACHGTTSTCNGCHSHGTHSSSSKTGVNVKGATNKTSYAPGETVSVTITGGYKTGWIRAILYDQTMKQVAISKGTIKSGASAPSGGPGFPITLSAPAPTTTGTYTWNVSWYGNKFDATGAFFQQACSSTVTTNCWKASTNANHGEAIVATNSFTVAAVSGCTRVAPTVTFNPTAQNVAAGGTVTYTATVTNKDTGTSSLIRPSPSQYHRKLVRLQTSSCHRHSRQRVALPWRPQRLVRLLSRSRRKPPPLSGRQMPPPSGRPMLPIMAASPAQAPSRARSVLQERKKYVKTV